MILEQGQIINDGENDLIVCATKEYENNWYAYVLNSETDEVGFYKVKDIGNDYDFELVEDEKNIEELILVFAKDYANEHKDEFTNISINKEDENA